MKKKINIIITAILALSATSANAASIPRESAPMSATEENIVIAEKLIGGVLDEVQNGLGYTEARAKSNVIIRNAVVSNQTNGYGYAILSGIANNAILQYRNMYLAPEFYTENEEKVRTIIAEVLTRYAGGIIDYNKAVEESQICLYQSVNPSFNPDEQFTVDTCYRDIPAVDSRLFTIARKLLLSAKK